MISRRFALFACCPVLVLGLAVSVAAATAADGVTLDSSLANDTVRGKIVNQDPNNAVVEITNLQHFWKGISVQEPVGNAKLSPRDISLEPENIYAWLGVLGPEASTSLGGTFDPGSPSSVSVAVSYDLRSANGAVALGMTCLGIVADTFGVGLTAVSPAALRAALEVLTTGPEFIDLQRTLIEGNSFSISRALLTLFSSESGSRALAGAMKELGVIISTESLKEMATPLGLWSFKDTIVSLAKAGLEQKTIGVLTVSYRPPTPVKPATPTDTPSPTRTPTPPQEGEPLNRVPREVMQFTGVEGLSQASCEAVGATKCFETVRTLSESARRGLATIRLGTIASQPDGRTFYSTAYLQIGRMADGSWAFVTTLVDDPSVPQTHSLPADDVVCGGPSGELHTAPSAGAPTIGKYPDGTKFRAEEFRVVVPGSPNQKPGVSGLETWVRISAPAAGWLRHNGYFGNLSLCSR